jgi:hypothetical protein
MKANEPKQERESGRTIIEDLKKRKKEAECLRLIDAREKAIKN